MKKLICFLIFPFLLSSLAAQSETDENANFREFDFWVGEWIVYRTGSTDTLGYSKIESIIDGFAVQESFKSARSKYVGTSINKYNLGTGQWEQFWVDNTGLTLYLKGKRTENKMVLENLMETDEGLKGNRITWTANEDGTVQQVWEQSSDEGESWSKIFDGLYVKPGELNTIKKKGKKSKKSKN